MAHKFQLILQEKIALTSSTYHFKFMTDQTESLEFKAGQFISLHIEHDGKDHRRNYSIANSPNNDNYIELAMSYMPNGLASEILINLKPGDAVQASGPYGQFVLKDEVLPKRYLLIGTGTGITPYRSMLPELSKMLENNELEVVILQGVRTKEDLLYGDEFVEFMAKNPRAIFKACYSRGCPAEQHIYEVEGYVQDHLSGLQVAPTGDIVYLCGNPNMVDAAFNQLQEIGIDRAHIRREKYISSK